MTNYFITGTDTGCGKTEITLALMHAMQQAGEQVIGMKPVASGAEQTPEGLRNEDALAIQNQGSTRVAYDQINPYAFSPPVAPHLAAAEVGVEMSLEKINECYRQLSMLADRVLVEGVGGWRVPINVSEGVSELVRALDLPVILVVGVKLGCINHALLTVEAIQSDGLRLAGWIANQVESDMLMATDNIATLKGLITVPHLGSVPYLPGADRETIAACLSLQNM
ncbi:MAG: dethiobiotin synthase [Gammaproteobacteria bacterium]|nr:dethiobiotin synthase [Gammaproteobacteria bacterium]